MDAEYRPTFIPSSRVWESLSNPVGGRRWVRTPVWGISAVWCQPSRQRGQPRPFRQRFHTESELTKPAELGKGKRVTLLLESALHFASVEN